MVQIRAGRSDQAVSALDRALAIHAACGARRDLARVRRRLRQLGIQRRLPAERRPTHGWAALTDSELAVVRLAADGLTNREIAERLYVSPHTVNGHLRHAFEKLGINSRVALTRIVTQHSEPAQQNDSSADGPARRPGEGAEGAEHEFGDGRHPGRVGVVRRAAAQ